MKKQWLSMILALCMVLCLTPTTAHAAEGKTGTLKITVDISGVYEGDNVGDKTFRVTPHKYKIHFSRQKLC